MQDNTGYNLIREYYERPEVLFQLFEYLRNREFAMLLPNYKGKEVRHLKITNMQGIAFWLKCMSMGAGGLKNYNLYYSMAGYDNIPPRSGNMAVPIDKAWWDEHYKHMISYDFFIDIDCKYKEIDFGIESADSVMKYLDSMEAPYELVFSGRGFHIKTPYDKAGITASFVPGQPGSIYSAYRSMLQHLHDRFSEFIDVDITDSRRLCKIPYSLAVYKDATRMSFQFNSRKEWDDFRDSHEEMVRPEFWIGKIFKRGRYIFNPEGNLRRMLDDAAKRL